jgi:hypothetical protein
MKKDLTQAWERFLDPAIIRPQMICACVYIAAFESLRESIVSRIKDFYWIGFDESGHKTDPSYDTEVLSRNRSPVLASLDWLKERNAIDDADVDVFRTVKGCRNVLVHELMSLLSAKGLPTEFNECFEKMVALHRKIEIWWIMEFEIPINPRFDGQEIDPNEVVPGPMIALNMLCEIALGDEQKSGAYLREFRKAVEKQ